MDIETFMQQTPPKALRSRLVPYTQQIALLKAKGYSNQQVLDWLAMNGIQISLEGLRIFVNKYCKDPKGLTAAANTNVPPPAGQQRMSEPSPAEYPAHDPRAITQILGSPVDLDELAKYAPKRTREKP